MSKVTDVTVEKPSWPGRGEEREEKTELDLRSMEMR